MVIFDGKKLAEEILWEIKENIAKEKIKPVLSLISVGENPASNLFIKNKKKAAKKIGIDIQHHKFRDIVSEKEIIEKIEELNKDNSIDGIIVQLPLPEKINTDKIIEKIDYRKDVDGFNRINRDLVKEKKNPYFFSPFILAIFTALKSANKDFKSQKILAIVNSKTFGESLKDFLEKEGIKIDFILKKKHYFLDIRTKLKSADIIITACGCIRELKGDMIKEGTVLIDGGIVVLSNGKVVGDIDRKSVEKKAAFLTPVPGGTGPLTVAFLLKNVYLAAKQ